VKLNEKNRKCNLFLNHETACYLCFAKIRLLEGAENLICPEGEFLIKI